MVSLAICHVLCQAQWWIVMEHEEHGSMMEHEEYKESMAEHEEHDGA